MSGQGDLYLGVMTGPHDPSAAIVRDGQVLALVDEERFIRHKHAFGVYPVHAIRYCLDQVGARLSDVQCIAMPWDVDAYTDGTIARFFARWRERWDVDPATRRWQDTQLRTFEQAALEARHRMELRQVFPTDDFPGVIGTGHHHTHAFQAAHEGPFAASLVVVLDGSGDMYSGSVWAHEGQELTLLRAVELPHSLGWFYAAVTEYLGFDAYDGEYKVMGLAAHGQPDPKLDAVLAEVVHPAADGVAYEVEPRYLHYGAHSYSTRFTDEFVHLLGAPPRARTQTVEKWHSDVALAAQGVMEQALCRLVEWGMAQTGLTDVGLGGGIAMNVKMSAAVAAMHGVTGVFAHPGCADNGAAAGAALVACQRAGQGYPRPLRSMALGPAFTPEQVEATLRAVGATYEKPADPHRVVAAELAGGAVVAWFRGRMEAGSRALGHRSILADPRSVEMRERVNAMIKHREPWRPFAPSVLDEHADRYIGTVGDARFMTMAFPAGQRLRADAPAVVHVDGTSRVHLVLEADNPGLHRLIREFAALTGVPMLLNTSFNLAGEPIVCTPADALRTFWSSGLDLLMLENCLVRKTAPPAWD